jgi:hypothetical protein
MNLTITDAAYALLRSNTRPLYVSVGIRIPPSIRHYLFRSRSCGDFAGFGFADTGQKLGDRYLIGPRYFVTIVDTEKWLIANIQSVKYAGAAVAFITLAFF